MATQGGARVGAGRKRKPLAEKLENNAGRRKIKYWTNVKQVDSICESII